MVWPFDRLPPLNKSNNVIAFPMEKRQAQVRADRAARNDDHRGMTKVWTNSEDMPWNDYTDMVRDLLVDIRLGHVKPSGMLIAVVDDNVDIGAVVMYTKGLNEDEVIGICKDVIESLD